MTPAPHAASSIDAVMREGARRLGGGEGAMLDARILMQFVTRFDDVGLISAGPGAATPDQQHAFLALIARRAAGEPVAYLVGEKEFWSLRFEVTPDVLIPRGDSETLIEAVLARRSGRGALKMLDLGVGSGCLLCALLSEFAHAWGVGVDRAPAAVRIARKNAAALGYASRSAFFVGDWMSALAGRFDIVVANPPYIPEGERASLPRDVVDFEPAQALFGGKQGCDFYEEILNAAPRIMNEGALLAIEAGDGQAERLARLCADAFPGAAAHIRRDLKGAPRAVVIDLGDK